jgi:hypothetical protein
MSSGVLPTGEVSVGKNSGRDACAEPVEVVAAVVVASVRDDVDVQPDVEGGAATHHEEPERADLGRELEVLAADARIEKEAGAVETVVEERPDEIVVHVDVLDQERLRRRGVDGR